MSDENTEKIEVTVKDDDSEEIKKLKEELQEEKEKVQLMQEQEINRQLDKYDIKDPEKREEFIANPEMWTGYRNALKEQKEQNEKGTGEGASGSLPLSPEQIAGGIAPSWIKQQFNSPKEMVDTIKDKMVNGTPEEKAQARVVYDILLKKALSAKHQTGESEGIGLKEMVKKPKKRDD